MRWTWRHMILIAGLAFWPGPAGARGLIQQNGLSGSMQVAAEGVRNTEENLSKATAEQQQVVRKQQTTAGQQEARQQQQAARKQQTEGNFLPYVVEGKDTIYIDSIRASKVYSRVPKQKGKNWRKYYRLVHNFSKTYPYALVAKDIVIKADSTIVAENMKRMKRDKYINSIQKELFQVFEKPLRNLTINQGALLMKLIDREVGKSSYNIIKDYKNGMAAGFWQGIAKLFGSDLKKPYDPEGEDANVEELVQIWEDGDFPAFYWSLFWKDPPEPKIPDKYKKSLLPKQ